MGAHCPVAVVHMANLLVVDDGDVLLGLLLFFLVVCFCFCLLLVNAPPLTLQTLCLSLFPPLCVFAMLGATPSEREESGEVRQLK